MANASRLLLTNDDGIGAPGLEALRLAIAPLGSARVIAPSGPQSGCGHAVTTHQPIDFSIRDDGQVAIGGTPADCVRLALARLESAPDWEISGINAGGNLGVDVYHSGTVAAAREAAIRGVRAISISHYIRKGVPLDWNRAGSLARQVISFLLEQPTEPLTFWNVNLPHLEPLDPDPEWKFCPVDPSPLPLDYDWDGERVIYSGVYSQRPRRSESDISVCFSGSIAVSLIRII